MNKNFDEILQDLLLSSEGDGPFATVSEFAQRTGVQASQLSRIKNGRDLLADGVRDKIVDYYSRSNPTFAKELKLKLIAAQGPDNHPDSGNSALALQTGPAGRGEILEIFKSDPSTTMQVVAERLMVDRRMPFYGIYLPLRGAGRWVFYSEQGEAASEKKRKHEGDQCEHLLGSWLLAREGETLSVISLGVGEGVGEIEILERLLRKYNFKNIHYCAIDTNIYLLMDHATRLRNRFKSYISSRQLICSVVRGNFLTHFSELISVARAEVRRQIGEPGFVFLPDDSGKLVTILGNIVGNLERRASEWTYFQPILDEFQSQNVAFLIGIGVKHGDKDEPEEYPLDDLFLSTLRYLKYDLELLESDADVKNREFYPTDKNFRCETRNYQGDGFVSGAHISGDIYEFIYTTMGTLSMKLDTNDKLTMPRGSDVLLYNIIKFDLDNFVAFLESRGLHLQNDLSTLSLGQKKEERLYAVIAATTEPLPGGTT